MAATYHVWGPGDFFLETSDQREAALAAQGLRRCLCTLKTDRESHIIIQRKEQLYEKNKQSIFSNLELSWWRLECGQSLC